eukprot:TRINITY_DN2067_c2_g1_i1.p1 TRINITY_DN2067_c2_g1~~TRINITY_DN2067_c2_g1_i1.p1  ORF type:complete len:103 (-),score=4.03 TRINITY_DN2067_c2_g1_i1:23-331(-)
MPLICTATHKRASYFSAVQTTHRNIPLLTPPSTIIHTHPLRQPEGDDTGWLHSQPVSDVLTQQARLAINMTLPVPVLQGKDATFLLVSEPFCCVVFFFFFFF